MAFRSSFITSKKKLATCLEDVCSSLFDGRKCPILNICMDVVKHHTGFSTMIPVQPGREIAFSPAIYVAIIQVHIGMP
jgi:hypothetical protein